MITLCFVFYLFAAVAELLDNAIDEVNFNLICWWSISVLFSGTNAWYMIFFLKTLLYDKMVVK